MSSFETYDFASNPAWNKIESSLEIPLQLDRDAVILKRKKKFYKQHVDPTYTYDDVPLSSRSSTSSTSSSSSFESEQAPGGPRTSSTSQSQYQTPPNQQTYEQYNGPLRSTTTGTTHPMWSSSLGIILTYFQLFNNIMILCCIIMYILSFIAPMLGWDVDVMQQTWYGRALKASAAACLIHILRTQGRPRYDKEYGRVLLLDETTHFLFLSLILLTSSPFLLGLIPIGIRALVFTCQSFKILLPKYIPALWNVLSDPITKITSRAAEWTRINATLEVTIGLSLILQLITPFRNFMLLFIYWQYLRMRYMLSYDTQRAFAEVRIKIDEYTQHSRCPTFIRTAWLKLYGFVCNMVDPQQQQQQMPKCTIM